MTNEKSDTPEAMRPVSQNAPVLRAWNIYKQSADYANTRKWAKHDEHVDGSLWAAFYAGYFACAVAESAQAPNSDGVERPFIRAFSIKRGKEDGIWYLHGEELVPGLNLVGKNLADVLADLIPAWKRLYEVSPQQVPSPNEMDER